jgi:hypothetical protein
MMFGIIISRKHLYSVGLGYILTWHIFFLSALAPETIRTPSAYSRIHFDHLLFNWLVEVGSCI